MATPIVSWRLRDNSALWHRWDIDVVDAGTESGEFGFLIWNNHNNGSGIGEDDVPDMEDCTITVKDELGGNTGDLVERTWIRVRVDSIGESSFTPIGYDTVTSSPINHPIKTTESTSYTYPGDSEPTTSTPGVEPHDSSVGEVSILGVANDGTMDNSRGNFVELTMKALVPGDASAGLVNFLTRTSYKYV